jgi:CRISPR-associated endonuclease/helicase Cas3
MTDSPVQVPDRPTFNNLFEQLTGIQQAYHWQWLLFRDFVEGKFHSALTLPTGLGKTSVMYSWFLALVWELAYRPGKRAIPTRLVWVVDRRVVVDQATTEAERLASVVAALPSNHPFRVSLEQCSIAGKSSGILAISTLRGERADNRAWSIDPSRPAIIVGTVDMIGSRLLFSGYGDSRRRRASHAGLLGQDTLMVNDEAHLTPAFASLIVRLSQLSGGPRPLRTMLLSATPSDEAQSTFPPDLDADLSNGVFAARYRAVKRLHLHEQEDARKKLEELALQPYRRTLIFVRSPEQARKFAAAIERKFKGTHVPLITGMQRGWERDRLLEHPVVKRYVSKQAPPTDAEPCWLVATSAGEVGIDLSSDRVLTELDTADHLLQRFGRLNRFGETEGYAHVFYSKKQITGNKGEAQRLAATVEYLKTLPDVSPETVRNSPPPQAAKSETPHLAPLLPWHIDVWSMTSIDASEWPSRPTVDAWLHGSEEASPPETYVAWRRDVKDLADPNNGVSPAELELVFAAYRVLAQERLKQYTEPLCKALAESTYLASPAILIAADAEVYVDTLEGLLKNPERFRYATLLLPPGIGYLDANGTVDWGRRTDELSQEDLARYDVADHGANRQRFRLNSGDPDPDNIGFRFRHSIQLEAEEDEGSRWLYFSGVVERRASPRPQPLSDHQRQVGDIAAQLVRQLGLGEPMTRVFRWVGQWHDKGKDRPIWQRAAGNGDSGSVLAKSERFNGRLLGGYRHEFGSLLDAVDALPPEFSSTERDLALHLIAAHHGWARPHFPERGYDKNALLRSRTAALEVARRYGRLHRSFGAWNFAYLEAIFRAADAIGSENAPELPIDA